ncbi:cytochrome P450 [Heliocybe sulcata]|uniref:Cytochrome P450 n=1 Tax=Heliocybe sulcata TaxID=5364 RepID=A0A5C3NBH1_9AGAM|nr:cytochrome P450 [Heliocybe sulcata]
MGLSLLSPFLGLGVFLLLLKAYFSKRALNPTGLPYPPGPKPSPIIGNLLDVPKKDSWKTYKSWGELVHLTVFSQHFIVLNSMRVAVDLLEKRSKKYSDRPVVPMITMTGWDWNIGLMPYGDAWRHRRREFHQQFKSDKSVEYYPTIMTKAHEFIIKLLISPEVSLSHIRDYPGSIIMSIVYNYKVASENDHFVGISEKAVEMLSGSSFPGAAIVNGLPILQNLPSWLPGMGFKRYAEHCKTLMTEMKNAPFQFVKDRLKSGTPTRCLATNLIDRLPGSYENLKPETEEIIKDVCAIAYAAGADTTVASIKTGFLAMCLYPDARRKAQSELDAVVGPSRLPTFDDRKSLPYVEAFVWEVLRWHPVAPLSVARSVYEDDIYKGKFLPKGAIVLMNTWAIYHNEETYPEPDVFKPERFLHPDGTLSDSYPIATFGAGRRICPGRHLADATVWAALALVLAAFDVDKAKDEHGNVIDVPELYFDGLVSHPVPFPCRVSPRSEEAKSLVRGVGRHG